MLASLTGDESWLKEGELAVLARCPAEASDASTRDKSSGAVVQVLTA